MRKLLIVLFSFIAIAGCDNELHVTATWKEVPVVYGLLDPEAEYNYLRINRAYLNEQGDALQYAGVSDSINFENLTVKLVEHKNGIETNSIVMQKVNGDTIGLPKDEGIFSNSPNILYRTGYKIQATSLYDTYYYDLVIVNEVSGKIYHSNAISVGPMFLVTPRLQRASPTITISDENEKFIYIDFQEGFNAAMYDLVIRFRYFEYPKGKPILAKMDSVDWTVFTGRETHGLDGRGEQIITVKGSAFYEFLRASIEADSTVEREGIDCDFSFYGSGEDLYTYVQVNKPSIGIVQKKPEYTNIENGLGIFSFRHVNRFTHVGLTDEMKNRLMVSERTESLNFVIP
ncbi:MAG: hypothetical protein GC181_15100 [Bacteroidetes bacterium]|nr:hypothetical protein [Bacteroidota bacterium]